MILRDKKYYTIMWRGTSEIGMAFAWIVQQIASQSE